MFLANGIMLRSDTTWFILFFVYILKILNILYIDILNNLIDNLINNLNMSDDHGVIGSTNILTYEKGHIPISDLYT